jgi:hypothetical protein
MCRHLHLLVVSVAERWNAAIRARSDSAAVFPQRDSTAAAAWQIALEQLGEAGDHEIGALATERFSVATDVDVNHQAEAARAGGGNFGWARSADAFQTRLAWICPW